MTYIRWMAAFLIATFISSNVYAQQQMVKFSSGTGFFVSRQGHIVTNAHVLKRCKKIFIQGTGFQPAEARMVKSDTALDLAILKTNVTPERIAFLRNPQSPIAVGEKLMVLGYPGDSAKTGRYKVKYSKVKHLNGPTGSKQYMQFENASSQGNSGGPLLDFSGNVVGVIMAKATTYRVNKISAKNEKIGTADIAISLDTLKAYLKKNGIYYYRRDSLMQLSKGRMEKQARNFTVGILCQQNATSINIRSLSKQH